MKKPVLLFCSVVFYIALFKFIQATGGHAMGIAGIVPAVLAGLLYGMRAGLLAGALAFPATCLLCVLFTVPDWIHKVAAEAGVGHLAIVLIGGVVGRIRDLSTRVRSEAHSLKKLQNELSLSRDRFSAIAEYSPSAILYADHNNRIVYWNPAAEKIFGYTQQEAIGEPAHMLVPERLRIADRERFQQFMETKTERFPGNTFEAAAQRKNGEEFPVEIAFSAWKSGGEIFLSSIISDITERKLAAEELLKSKNELQVLFKSMINAFALFDSIFDDEGHFISYRFVYVNDAYERIVGVTNSEVKGKTVHEVWPDTELEWVTKYGEVASTGVSQTFDLYHAPTKKIYHCNVYRPGDTHERFCVVFDDITEQKQAEKELMESEEKFRKLSESSPFAIMIYQGDSWVYANPASEKISGFSVQELYAMRYWDFVAEDYRDIIRQSGRNRQENNSVEASHEFKIITKSGSLKWVYLTGNSITYLGKPAGIISVVDITERKLAEEALITELAERRRVEAALHETESLLTEARQIAHIGTWIYNIETGQFKWSDEIYNILGLPFSSHMSFSEFTRYVHPEDYPALVQAWNCLSDDCSSVEMEYRIVRPSGEIRHILEYIIYKYDDSGQILSAAGLQLDITDRRRAEEKLRRANAELQTTIVRANAMAQKAEVANVAKSEFLSSMSHEIRTPMTAIIGMADLLSESPLTDEQQRFVHVFKAAGENLLTLINDILDLSKVEAGQMILEETSFDLNELMERLGDVMAVRAHEKSLELSILIAGDVRLSRIGDPVRLRQILVNLVGNAIKFTKTGEVSIKVENAPDADRGSRLLFSIRDTGIGIEDDKLDLVFDRFTQADSSTTRTYGGTGLGLPISRQLIQLMGGTIWVASRVGEGSTFYFTACLAEQSNGQPPELPAEPAINGLKTLVVDDTATNRLILREYMSRWGARVEEAEDGCSALEVLRAAQEAGDPFSLVLLDACMPAMDGFALAQALQQDHGMKGCTVMMLSSSNRSGDIAKAKALGCAGFLVKPVKKSDLLEVIKNVLGQRQVVIKKRPAVQPEPPPAQELTARILLADDTEDNRLLISTYIKKTGCSLTIAENGALAVEKFKTGSYDIVLMDVEMPVMDGYTATAEIRKFEKKQGRTPTPIVALTAHAMAENVRESLRSGCDRHISKPFKKADLLEAIRILTKG